MEEEFKKKLTQVEVDWDKEELWDSLAPQLNNGKSWSFRGFLLLLALLTLVLGGIFIGKDKFQPSLADAPSVADTEGIATKHDNSHVEQNNSPSKTEQATSNDTPQVQQQQQQQQLDFDQQKNKAKFLTNASVALRKNDPDANSTVNQYNADSNKSNNSSQSKSSDSVGTIFANENEISTTTNSAEQNVTSSSIKKLGLATDTTEKLQELPEDNTLSFSSSSLNNLQFASTELAVLVSTPLQLIPRKNEVFSFSILPTQPKTSVVKTAGFIVEIGLSLGKSFRKNTKPEFDSEYEIKLINIKEKERPLFNSGFDLQLGYQWQNGFLIKTGIGFQSIFEVLEWENTSFSSGQMTVEYDKAYFETGPANDTTFFSGNVNAQQSNTRRIIHNNRLLNFIIPLNIGYQKTFGRIGLEASGGIHFSLLPSFFGKTITIDVEEGQEYIAENPKPDFKNPIGFQFSLGSFYELPNKNQVFMRANYEQSPTLRMNGLLFNYQKVNVMAGLRVLLN